MDDDGGIEKIIEVWVTRARYSLVQSGVSPKWMDQAVNGLYYDWYSAEGDQTGTLEYLAMTLEAHGLGSADVFAERMFWEIVESSIGAQSQFNETMDIVMRCEDLRYDEWGVC